MKKMKRQEEEQYFVLKNGRKVKQGDTVNVLLTPRIIQFFLNIGAMTEVKGSDLDIDDRTYDHFFEKIFRDIGIEE